MKTIQSISISTKRTSCSVAFAALILAVGLSYPVAAVHAQVDNTGWYDTGSAYTPNTGWFDTGSANTPSVADSGSTAWFDTGSAYTPNTGWFDTGSAYTPSVADSGSTAWFDTGSAYTPNTGWFDTGSAYTPSTGSISYVPPSTNLTSNTFTPSNPVVGAAAYAVASTLGYNMPGSALLGYGGGGSSAFRFNYAPTDLTYKVNAPTTVTTTNFDNGNTTAFNNGNTTIANSNNTTSCTTPNSCNTVIDDHSVRTSTVDNHSVYNAPTTITNNGNTNSVGYASAPVSYPIAYSYPAQASYFASAATPFYASSYVAPTAAYIAPAPVAPILSAPAGPSVSLSQIPYTGFDFGPLGNALYWTTLLLFAVAAGYLVTYYLPALYAGRLGRGARFALAAEASHTAPASAQEEPATEPEVQDEALELPQNPVAGLPLVESRRITADSMFFEEGSGNGAPRIVISRS